MQYRLIFLVGYMACGKSTLGQALSDTGCADFVDLDEVVTSRTGLSPAEWFSRHGEAAFRQAEVEALRRIEPNADRPLIVATGGGTPCNEGAMEHMLRAGSVVWLKASLDRTVARLLEADGQRPLVAGMDEDALRRFIPGHFGLRKPFYAKADFVFDSSRLDTPEEIAATVQKFKDSFNL